MYFQKFPLVRLVIAFALGIVAYHYISFDLKVSLIVLSIVFLFLLLLNRKFSIQLNYLFGAFILIFFFQLGVHRLSEKLDFDNEKLLINQDLSEVEAYKAWLYKMPERAEKSDKLSLEIISVFTDNLEKRVKGKVILYTDTLTSVGFKAGDILYIQSAPQPTKPPANPYEFDYQEYLSFQNIRFQHYEKRVQKIGHHRINPAWKVSFDIREKAKSIFESHIENPKTRSIALALVLGQKDELDDKISNAFAAAGAMHVLAVSGLHVGLIYLLFSTGFKRLPYRIRKLRWLEASLSILILLIYAILTGMSPSVMRAVTMFGFMAIGRASRRGSNIYNSLAASAMVLLMIDPYLIMSVGFQLSYLAVIGIVYLQPKFYALIKVESWFLDKVWSITCVSLAAQLATAPLSMLYFHQFPTYFLISNLFIIPAAFIILLSGIGLIAFSFSDVLAHVFGLFLDAFIGLTNTLVSWVSNLPLGQVQGIQLSVFETWLIYGMLISIIYAIGQKKIRRLYLGVVFSFFFCLSQLAERARSIKEHELTVFDIPGEKAIQFRKGSLGKLIADSTLLNDFDRLSFHIYPSRLIHHMNQEPINDLIDIPNYELEDGDVLVFDELKILVLGKGFQGFKLIEDLNWDICVLNTSNVNSGLKAKEFILNSRRYKSERNLEVEVHSIAEEGYYSKIW